VIYPWARTVTHDILAPLPAPRSPGLMVAVGTSERESSTSSQLTVGQKREWIIVATANDDKMVQKLYKCCATASKKPPPPWRVPACSKQILDLVRSKAGFHREPRLSEEGDPLREGKYMVTELTLLLTKEKQTSSPSKFDMKLCAAVYSVLNRLAELCKQALTDASDTQTIVEMHNNRGAPTWSPSARGSGLVVNERAFPILMKAIEDLEMTHGL
jgi:hypothetical protein